MPEKKPEKKRSISEICHIIADRLIKKYSFKTISGKKGDEIYVYINGVYEVYGRDAIRIEVEKQLDNLCTSHYVREIILIISRKTLTERNSMGCKEVSLICLDNGVLNLKTMKLMPHDPKYRFMSKIPIYYDKSARCPKIEKFIYDIVYEEDADTMQEWIGYMLYRSYFLKRGVICVGMGDTGKTTLLNLIGKFIGEKNISGVSLQKLSSDKFAAAHLYNKHANIYDDLSTSDITDVGAFKIATGGGYIQGEYKFGDQFQFKNHSKLTFATNKIPSTKINDDDMAYYRRWIVFRFDNVFDDKNKDTNKDLIHNLTSGKELSGLLNWALKGLRRLLKNKKFSYNKDIEEVKRLIHINSDDLAKFAEECMYRGSEEDWMSKDELYEHYKEYMALNNLPVVTKMEFGRNITKFCSYIMDSRHQSRTGWRTVKVVEVKPVFGM